MWRVGARPRHRSDRTRKQGVNMKRAADAEECGSVHRQQGPAARRSRPDAQACAGAAAVVGGGTGWPVPGREVRQRQDGRAKGQIRGTTRDQKNHGGNQPGPAGRGLAALAARFALTKRALGARVVVSMSTKPVARFGDMEGNESRSELAGGNALDSASACASDGAHRWRGGEEGPRGDPARVVTR